MPQYFFKFDIKGERNFPPFLNRVPRVNKVNSLIDAPDWFLFSVRCCTVVYGIRCVVLTVIIKELVLNEYSALNVVKDLANS